MSRLYEGLLEALRLIISFDPDLLTIVLLSLRVSITAILLATLIGVPIGTLLGLKEEKKTGFFNKIIFTFMGMPPVVAGLIIFLILSRQGPLGVLGLLYTPSAMIIAQVFLASPIVIGLTMVGIRAKGGEIEETARSLGAGSALAAWTVVKESRYAILGAVITGFSRVVAEVGAVMIVGGNIEGHTRVMTTAIVLETRKGNFELAIGLGIILLMISFIVNSVLYTIQKGGKKN
ncbi:MAG: ABC transporter permease [Bacillota bacterium]|nr:ABC transporter permease [Bacillota bacterium]MDW7728437.1 ABC transporter permease [Bacillota bacterium]